MPSILPGYTYDIFISYRQNDNRSGWVTEFVKALQEDLASTIKDPVSVYFDSNPHDGLLETHNVDKSLEDKLKCIIFIPVISQTYCDTKSFAWQHEFCAFNRISKLDRLGRDIKLGSGNVASRILPVRIHDLETDDKLLLENELGGPLRSVDFVFRTPGVNRPLGQNEEHARDNLNATFYKDQINKVSNAIKELIQGMKGQPGRTRSTVDATPYQARRSAWKILTMAATAVLVFAIAGYVYFKFQDGTGELDKSIAVLPFTDMSAAKDQEYLGDGLAEEIISALAQSTELKVIARTSSFQFKGKAVDLRNIGEALGVATVLEGSVRKLNDQLRITAQLIETRSGTHLWSRTFDRSSDDILKVQDEIAQSVAAALKGKLLNRETHTRNPEVYNLVLQAKYFTRQRERGYYEKSLGYYSEALAIDSSDATIWAGISTLNIMASAFNPPGLGPIEALLRARKAAEKALKLNTELPEVFVATGNIERNLERNWRGAEEEFRKALELDPGNVNALAALGSLERGLGDFTTSVNFIKLHCSLTR